ncbi:MAG TPA: L,D-transpeptidase [Gemmatimonadales bacterium]|nr:L,D-transpeptidase [Gemmatimonadales bacterium]
MQIVPWQLAPLWLWASVLAGASQAPRLDINLPARRLDLIVAGRIVRTYRVAIGDSAYPSPTGRFLVRRIIWSPSWVPPADAPWSRDLRPEPPGPDNPMGPVKLPLGKGYFIHGSPRSIGMSRPPTHGCVRLRSRDAVALAHFLESDTGSIENTDALGNDTTRTVPLAIPIQVLIRYDLVEVRLGRVIANPDPYHRRTPATDSADARLLRVAGYPADSALGVVSGLLDSARGRVGAVSAPLRR